MNCRKVNNLLSAYIDGELGGVEQLQVRQHLQECPCCEHEHESLLTTKRLLSGLCVKRPRPELEQRILSHLNDVDAGGKGRYGMRVQWAMMPDKFHHWYRMGAFCLVSSVALAIVMVSFTPVKEEIGGGRPAAIYAEQISPVPSSRVGVQQSMAQQRPDMPFRDVMFLHNPMEGAQSGGIRQVNIEEPLFGAGR